MALYSAGTSVLNAGALVGAGKIIQIVRAHATSTTTTSSSSFTHFSGIDLSITPTSASNKLWVNFYLPLLSGDAGNIGAFRMVYDISGGASDTVFLPKSTTPGGYTPSDGVHDSIRLHAVNYNSWSVHFTSTMVAGTTSAITFKPLITLEGGGILYNRTLRDNNKDAHTVATSMIMELAV